MAAWLPASTFSIASSSPRPVLLGVDYAGVARSRSWLRAVRVVNCYLRGFGSPTGAVFLTTPSRTSDLIEWSGTQSLSSEGGHELVLT